MKKTKNRPAPRRLATLAILLAAACDTAPQPPAARQTDPATPATAPGAPSASTPAAAKIPVPDAETRAQLVGWWLRHDQSYMIVIDAVGEDGQVQARYLNPQPIQVSKAETWLEEGGVRMLLELTDQNYPGNFYELAYQPDQDIWIGLYHHLGNGETYEVYFTRFEDEER
jgi:hypothetical protein